MKAISRLAEIDAEIYRLGGSNKKSARLKRSLLSLERQAIIKSLPGSTRRGWERGHLHD